MGGKELIRGDWADNTKHFGNAEYNFSSGDTVSALKELDLAIKSDPTFAKTSPSKNTSDNGDISGACRSMSGVE